MSFRSTLALACCALLFSACASGPDYQQPDPKYNDHWAAQNKSGDAYVFKYESEPKDTKNEASTQTETEIKADWWQIFNDPILNKYIKLAIVENKELKAARANVKQSRALRTQGQAASYPTVDSRLSHSRQGTSSNNGSGGTRRTAYEAGIDASWELDLFGGISRHQEAELARFEGAVEERRAALLSVLAETARSYYEVRGIQKRIAILNTNLGLQQSTFDLVDNLFQMGEATEFDLSRARGQLQLSQAKLPDLDAHLKTGIFRLSTLMGLAPEALLQEMLASSPLPSPPDIVPVGLRSDILRRRPDVRIAERELAAATADIGVAVADLYPSFSLTGTIGRSASVFGDLFQASSNVFSIGPILRWPIFQGGAIRANIKVQEAEAEEALARYEQSVLQSLADVESALTRYAQKLLTRDMLKNALISSERSTELARLLFNSGEEDFLSVLDAERELSNVKDQLVVTETDTVLYLITLYTALGGGWELFEEQEQALFEEQVQ